METIELDGRRLSYSDRGTGRPLVFVHGVGTLGSLWADDLADLERDCRVIAYDRRGYGASGPSPGDWKAHADDAIALVEALDAGPALLAGFSGGAIVVLDIALRRPDLVSGLVLLDPAFNLKRCMTPRFARTLATAMALRRLRGERAGAEHWIRFVARHPDGTSSFDRAPPARRETILANAGAIFADFGSGGGEHVDEARLGAISVPVTIVDAQLSPAFLRRSCARLQRLMPQAQRVSLPNSGHHLVLDARDDVLAVLRDAVRAPLATA